MKVSITLRYLYAFALAIPSFAAIYTVTTEAALRSYLSSGGQPLYLYVASNITLTTQTQLVVPEPSVVYIHGQSSKKNLYISGAYGSRVIWVQPGATLYMKDITVKQGIR